MLALDPVWVPYALLMAHCIGDYWLQSDWMALNKGRLWEIALTHALFYTLPFLLITTSPLALLMIYTSHAVEDHFSLGKYLAFASNFLAPRSEWPKWKDTEWTGRSGARPLAITFFVYVAVDNTLHMVVNALAVYFL